MKRRTSGGPPIKNLEKSYIEITDRKRAVEEYLTGYK